ncbi:small GTPase superfamily [Lentinula aff. detonsa]|uniref:Small GTPase superfamily n=1 Tax=Lentinula aff. detonsa TaxID=2804958 RepID=A0AA38KSK9_9AGAR|nr:small GTPase superfamily [Lentinula aff. detonsa]KAJ3800689.1 small GTPase superfamily [Lentinula aff. detonsa]
MAQFKVVVLGAGGVGKSALTVRFIQGVFLENYDPTIEEEYRRSISVDGSLTTLEVLDTAGAEQFTSLNEVYIKAGKGFVLVFSLTQEASLKEVDHLRKQIYRIKGESGSIPIVVVGTKLDLVNEREVHRNTIQTLASRWNLPFYETSSKRNWHISDVFEDLVRQMRARYPPEQPSRRSKGPKRSPCLIM